MGLYSFGSPYAQTYKSQCEDCGKEVEVSTQQDHNPEYCTEVYVKCSSCGGSVPFVLPVN